VSEVQSKGGDLLGSLMGGGALATVIGALSKYAGIDASSTKGLLGTLLPLLLGVISSQFKNKPLNAQGLLSFFAEQKSNIAAAMPAGLSLGDIPGLSGARSAAAPAGSPMPPWLLPVAAVALLALGAWYYFAQPTSTPAPAGEPAEKPKIAAEPKPNIIPAAPDVLGDLTKLYTSATETLATIKDVPTAEAAVPALEGYSGTLDRLKPLLDKLPESAKTALSALQSKNLGPLKELVAKVLALPGVGDKLKPILDGLITKLTDIK
jgi:hypothetical protein